MSQRNTRRPTVKYFPADKQRRMDLLLDRNSAGKTTPEERAELETLVAEAEKLMVENMQRLAAFSRAHGGTRTERCTPVTVWLRDGPVK